MKKCALGILLILFCATPLYAALPPAAQRIREMQSILSTPNLLDILQNQSIETIAYKPNNCYEIITQSSTIEVIVHYIPTSRIGSVEFELEFKKPVSSRQKL